MESSLTAPFRGRVQARCWSARTSTSPPRRRCSRSSRSRRLAVRAAGRAPVVRVPDAEAEPAAPDRCHENLRRIEWLVLGYDIDAGRGASGRSTTCTAQCADMLACDPALIPRRAPAAGDVRRPARAVAPAPRQTRSRARTCSQSPQEHLHAWLRSLDAEAEGLPRAVRRRAASARWRTTGSTASSAPPLWRRPATGCSSPSSAPRSARAAIVAILDRRLEDADELAGHVGRGFPRGARPARPHVALEGRDPVARRPRSRGPLPVLRRAGDRGGTRAGLRRDGAARGGADRASPSAPTAQRADRRDRRLPASARAAADGRDERGPAEPLAGCSSRRWRAATTATRSLTGFEHDRPRRA